MRLNDLDLHVEIEGSGPPVVLLHGFTGSTRVWDMLRPALVGGATVISLDAIGHGQSASPDDPGRYTLAWSARDLVALLDTLGLDKVDLLGYSMGGRIALHFAVHHPERVRRLLLESTSPGIQHSLDRQQRTARDAELAERIERDGVSAFVADWEAQPLLQLAAHVGDAPRQEQRTQRLRNTRRGLANSLRGMGAGQQTPMWSRLRELTQPVQLIVGQHDARYQAIARQMHELLPNGALEVVAAAGHTVHVDQPARFNALVQCAMSRN